MAIGTGAKKHHVDRRDRARVVDAWVACEQFAVRCRELSGRALRVDTVHLLIRDAELLGHLERAAEARERWDLLVAQEEVHFRVVERIWRQTRNSCHHRATRNREREAVLFGNARRADGRDFVTNLLCVVAIEDLHARMADLQVGRFTSWQIYKLCGCIGGCGYGT